MKTDVSMGWKPCTNRASEDDDILDLVGGLQLEKFLNDEGANPTSTNNSKRGESRHVIGSLLVEYRDDQIV